ncbi:hypothetical protein SAMN05428950_1011907 [Sphingomonas sp. OV641]|nr:hypothetical protein SAMN05428950_1011907 [Sphingomonas sp. OV641]
MDRWRKADRVAERVVWAAVAVACGMAVWAISYGDWSFNPSKDDDFWGWANAIVGLAALAALSCFALYKAVLARSKV